MKQPFNAQWSEHWQHKSGVSASISVDYHPSPPPPPLLPCTLPLPSLPFTTYIHTPLKLQHRKHYAFSFQLHEQ